MKEDTLARRVAALEARVAELERPCAPRDDTDAAVLAAVAAAARDLLFTAASILEAAALDADLHAALCTAGLDTPRRLGTWLRRMRGCAVTGLRLERVGKGDAGAIWMIRAGRKEAV